MRSLDPKVREYQTVGDHRTQTGLLQATDHGGVLDLELATHVLAAFFVHFEHHAVGQLDRTGLDFQQQNIACWSQHHQIDLAMPITTLMHRVPRHTMKNLIPLGE